MSRFLFALSLFIGIWQTLPAQTYTAYSDIHFISNYSSNIANVFDNDSLQNTTLLDTLVVLTPPNHGIIQTNGNNSYNFIPQPNFGNTVFIDSMLYMGVAVYQHQNPDSSYAISDIAWVYFVANFDNLTCTDDCVYPGDVDNNGIVSAHDLLPLGIAYNTTGSPREFVSSEWFPYPANNWEQNFLFNGPNFKHADCNGNGIVGQSDFFTLINNYNKTHDNANTTFTPATTNQALNIAIEIQNDSIFIGDTIVADIRIGEPTDDYNLYGFAFDINYNIDDGNTAIVEFPLSFVNTNPDNTLSLYQKTTETQLDLALTRINHQIATGNGIVARIRFVMEDIIEGGKDQINNSQLQLQLQNVLIYAAADQPLSYNNIHIQNDSALVLLNTNTNATNGQITLYPMPTHDQLWVKSPNNIEQIQLTDLQGQTLWQQTPVSTKLTTIPLQQFPVGIYIISILSNNHWTHHKIVR